jgi:hypothetical protein
VREGVLAETNLPDHWSKGEVMAENLQEIEELLSLAVDRSKSSPTAAEAELNKRDKARGVRFVGSPRGALYNLAKCLGRIHRTSLVVAKNQARGLNRDADANRAVFLQENVVKAELCAVKLYGDTTEVKRVVSQILAATDKRMEKYGQRS